MSVDTEAAPQTAPPSKKPQPIAPARKAGRIRRVLLRSTIAVGSVVLVLGAAVGGLYVWALTATDSSQLARALVWGESDVGDIDRFPARTVRTGGDQIPLPVAGENPFAGLTIDAGIPFETYLADTDTTAFIALRGGEVVYEGYFNGAGPQTLQTSMSAAKSFVSTLVGIAIEEGFLRSLDDPVTVYLPELLDRDARFADITLRHLVSMSSGLRYAEWFSPWDDPTTTYYATDLRAAALRHSVIEEPPGTRFLYNNYNPLLVGMVLERATGMTVSAYLETRLWQPMGAEADASWSLDSRESGFEKMESGLNARALDYARFGQLLLDGGRIGDRQVIPEAWIDESTRIDDSNHNTGYQYFWWVDEETGGFAAEGNYCQSIAVYPDADVVLVRLGRSCGDTYWTGLLGELAAWIDTDASL